MQQCKGQSQNLLCLRSSPLLTTVTQLHNLFQLRLPSKMQWYFQSKMTMSESLSLTASPSELPNVNGPQSTIATQVEGIKPQVTWATERPVSWGPMHHMRAAVSMIPQWNLCHQPSCKIGIRLVIVCWVLTGPLDTFLGAPSGPTCIVALSASASKSNVQRSASWTTDQKYWNIMTHSMLWHTSCFKILQKAQIMNFIQLVFVQFLCVRLKLLISLQKCWVRDPLPQTAETPREISWSRLMVIGATFASLIRLLFRPESGIFSGFCRKRHTIGSLSKHQQGCFMSMEVEPFTRSFGLKWIEFTTWDEKIQSTTAVFCSSKQLRRYLLAQSASKWPGDWFMVVHRHASRSPLCSSSSACQ